MFFGCRVFAHHTSAEALAKTYVVKSDRHRSISLTSLVSCEVFFHNNFTLYLSYGLALHTVCQWNTLPMAYPQFYRDDAYVLLRAYASGSMLFQFNPCRVLQFFSLQVLIITFKYWKSNWKYELKLDCFSLFYKINFRILVKNGPSDIY